MKITRTAITFAAILLVPAAAFAQTGQGAPAAAKGKIAFVNSAEVQQKLGDFKSKLDELNRQFEPRVKEVQGLSDKITALDNTIKSQSSVLPPARIAEMTEQLDGMKRDQRRKAEDLQADADKAKNTAMAPLKERLQKFLTDFTARHGIALLIDVSNAVESNTLVWYDTRAEVTNQFVQEYNAAFPVSSTSQTPSAKPK